MCRTGKFFQAAHVHVTGTQIKKQKITHAKFFNSCIFQMLSFLWLFSSWGKKK